ncbi:MAG: membrane protein insertion efficiency factor YidD [Candidatus Doudnabacteria bacterium]|nr:membrane protein insertion efficiency factor YidD [Candidatus Doudnabacteria bacterium]
MMRILREINRVLAWPLIAILFLYQKTLSPDHGLLKVFYPWGYCKFYPTCSDYAMIVLRTKGIIGLPKIFKRVASCTPGSLGGIDMP